MSGMVKVISLLCAISFLPHVRCHTIDDAKKLLADKLTGYEKNFRPVNNQSAPLILFTGFELVSIQEFDEVQEKLTITAVFSLNWIDEFMKWDPDNYGGLTQLLIESDKVWTPNLVLTNNVDKIEKIGDAWQVIRFLPDGTSFYYPGNVFSASCKVDVTYYPWDRHRCGFNFAIWAHSAAEVIFLPSNKKVQTSYFSENGEWTFSDSSLEAYYESAYIEVYLHLERKPPFVLVNVILPIIFMAYLNSLIFLIPVECGERISYSITMLLALAVFLTLVGDNLPKTSSPMSIFSFYLLTVLIVSICITLATILNLRLYYTDDSEPVKGCLASFARCLKCKSKGSRYKKKRKDKTNTNRNPNNINGQIKTHKTGIFVSPGYDRTTISGNWHLGLPDRHWRAESKEEERNDSWSEHKEDIDVDAHVSWQEISAAFDKIFFTLSIVILTTATTLLFLVLLLNDKDS